MSISLGRCSGYEGLCHEPGCIGALASCWPPGGGGGGGGGNATCQAVRAVRGTPAASSKPMPDGIAAR